MTDVVSSRDESRTETENDVGLANALLEIAHRTRDDKTSDGIATNITPTGFGLLPHADRRSSPHSPSGKKASRAS